MGSGQSERRLPSDTNDFLHLKRATAIETALQRFARDVLHHQIRQTTLLKNPMNRDDVLVADGGGRLGLALETPARGNAASKVGGHHFESYHSVQRRLERLEHNAHA